MAQPDFTFSKSLTITATPDVPAGRVECLDVIKHQGGALPHLIATDGPIWPYRDHPDLEALIALAAVFGATVSHHSEGMPGAVTQAHGRVVGIGPVAEEAALYAFLTGRTLEMVTDSHEIPWADGSPDVIVIAGPWIDAELVKALLTLPIEQPPVGLIWAENRTGLLRQVLLRSAAARLNGRSAHPRIDIQTDMAIGRHATRNKSVLGANASTTSIREDLQAGAGLLTLVAHGSGWNIKLGNDLALCATRTRTATAERSHAPACVASGYCDLLMRPVSEAVERQHIVDPSEITARCLVLESCYATYVGSNAIAPMWAMLPHLVQSPRVGAVLAPTGLSGPTYMNLSANLLDNLDAGLPIGPALERYARSEEASRIRSRYLLFGDPGTRANGSVAPNSVVQRRFNRSRERPLALETPNEKTANLALLTELGKCKRKDTAEAGLATSAAPQGLVDSSAARKEELPGAATTQKALREATLAHLATIRGRVFLGWQQQSYAEVTSETEPCSSCGWPTVTKEVIGLGLSRTFETCPRCGDVRDQPCDSDLRATFSPPWFELHGHLPREGWYGEVQIAPTRTSDTRRVTWTAAASGEPVRHLQVAQVVWPTGPLWLKVILMTGTDLHVFGAVHRVSEKAS